MDDETFEVIKAGAPNAPPETAPYPDVDFLRKYFGRND